MHMFQNLRYCFSVTYYHHNAYGKLFARAPSTCDIKRKGSSTHGCFVYVCDLMSIWLLAICYFPSEQLSSVYILCAFFL